MTLFLIWCVVSLLCSKSWCAMACMAEQRPVIMILLIIVAVLISVWAVGSDRRCSKWRTNFKSWADWKRFSIRTRISWVAKNRQTRIKWGPCVCCISRASVRYVSRVPVQRAKISLWPARQFSHSHVDSVSQAVLKSDPSYFPFRGSRRSYTTFLI